MFLIPDSRMTKSHKQPERCFHVIGFAPPNKEVWTCLKNMKECKDPYQSECVEVATGKFTSYFPNKKVSKDE